MSNLTPKPFVQPQPGVQQQGAQQQPAQQQPLPPKPFVPTARPGTSNLQSSAQAFGSATRETSTKAAGSAQRVAVMIMADLGGADLPDVESKTLNQRQEKHGSRHLTAAQSRTAQPRNARAGKAQTDGAQRSRTVSVAGLELEEEDEERLTKAASDTISKLRTSGRQVLEQEHNEKYDPLERFALLHTAKLQIENEDLPEPEKEKLKASLNEMLTDLWGYHQDEIRKGLKNVENLEAAIDSMGAAANMHPASRRELRFLYGVKGTGDFDSPLSPMNMAKVLLRKFGSTAFGSAFTELRTKMSVELSIVQPERYVPRFWLSSSDASAFNTVQSTFAIARKMNMDLRQHAKIEPQASDAHATITVLGIAEAGKAKVHGLVAQIYDTRQLGSVVKGRVYKQVGVAVRSLPIPMWSQGQQRMEVLDELDKQVIGGNTGRMPSHSTVAERCEMACRIEWAKECANVAAGSAEQVADGGPQPEPQKAEGPAAPPPRRRRIRWGSAVVDRWRDMAREKGKGVAG
jgi:hypothetical protein